MTQAQSKSYGGVKKKLMGAICMLLVASIMVVSSTHLRMVHAVYSA